MRYAERTELGSLIRERGGLAAAALAANVSYAHAWSVVAGRTNPSKRVAEAIAAFVGRPVGELFPTEETCVSARRR